MRLLNSIFQVLIGSSIISAKANENSTGDLTRKYVWFMIHGLIRQFSRAFIKTSGTPISAVEFAETIS